MLKAQVTYVENKKYNRVQSGAKIFINCKESSITGTATNII